MSNWPNLPKITTRMLTRQGPTRRFPGPLLSRTREFRFRGLTVKLVASESLLLSKGDTIAGTTKSSSAKMW